MPTRKQKLIYYLALQDGRYDEKEYQTHKDAMKAYKKIKEPTKRGVCIMSYWKEIAS